MGLLFSGSNIEGLGVVDDTLYFREGSSTSPITHDIRLRKEAQFIYIERYNGTIWEVIGRVGGSISSDRFILDGELVEIKHLTDQDRYSIWRDTSTPGGNEFGTSAKTFWAISNSRDGFYVNYPTEYHLTTIESDDTNNLIGTRFEKNFVADKTVELEYFIFNLYKEMKGRMILYDVATNRKIYETMDDASFIETGGVDLFEYSNPSIKTGLINFRLKNLAYVIEGREYKIIFETRDSGYKGSSTFPYVINRGKIFDIETIATREWIQDSLPYKRLETDSVFYLKGNSVTLGSIRAIVIDGKVNYQELKAGGWDIANVQDIRLGERGLLSERLDALENAREFQNGFDATGTFVQLNNAQKGYYWIVNVAGTLGGEVLQINDIIICHTAILNPTNFDNFAIIHSTINVMRGATAILEGAIGLVPKPVAGDQNKVLFGSGAFRTVPLFESENVWTNLNIFLSNMFSISNNFLDAGIAKFSTDLIPISSVFTYQLPPSEGTLALKTDIPTPASTTPNKISSVGGAGSSLEYSRKDHTHSIDLATQANQGAMSSADKIKLDNVTENWNSSDVAITTVLDSNKQFIGIDFVATSNGTITPSMVNIKYPSTNSGVRALFKYLLKELGPMIGPMSGPRFYNGLLSTLGNTVYDSSTFIKTPLPTVGTITVNQTTNSAAPASTSTLFKLVLGRDQSNIYWVNVVGTNVSGSLGVKYETAPNVWSDAGLGNPPHIRTSASFTNGSGAYNNDFISQSFPAVIPQLLRIELY